ncbi:hypothetical protein [Ramlibacter sp. AN1133]|uniref:hypothetical protein n=1 Tax=Ramlibacter sp. AN1133 TaxID=3133429 RepID=UPI0030BBAA8C
MAHHIRFTKQYGKDLCAAVGVVLITAAILYSLPELEVDLEPGDVLTVVGIGAFLFVLKRVAWPLLKQLRRPRRVHRRQH